MTLPFDGPPNPKTSSDWNASHLGRAVRLKNTDETPTRYRLKALVYDAGRDGVTATLEAIVPSPRPGVISHFDLESIELV